MRNLQGSQRAPIPKSKEALFLKKCISIIHAELSNEYFSVEDLAANLYVDRSQLFRKVKATTGLSPSRLIRYLRLKKAMQLVQENTMTIAEIAFRTGFGSTSYFNRVFKEEFGKAPGTFRSNTSTKSHWKRDY